MIVKQYPNFKLILVDDLNPEDVAMLQALKARSLESSEAVLERLVYTPRREAFMAALMRHDVAQKLDVNANWALLDALMEVSSHNDASAPARRMHQRYTVGYGHKSIADCGFATVVVENVSLLCAKALERHALYNGQETSTRAADFSKQVFFDPIRTAASDGILERYRRFYLDNQDVVADGVRLRFPRSDYPDATDESYELAVKSRAFDVLRGFLPAAATTHVTMTMTLRQFGDHLTTLLLHPLDEVRAVARAVQAVLRERYPSSGRFGGAAGVSGVAAGDGDDLRDLYDRAVAHEFTYTGRRSLRGTFAWHKPKPIKFQSTVGLAELLATEEGQGLLRDRQRGNLLPRHLGGLGLIACEFDLDFGSWRDLERHRDGFHFVPMLRMGDAALWGTSSTWAVFHPWYFDQLPRAVAAEARELVLQQKNAIIGERDNNGGFALEPDVDDVLKQYFCPLCTLVPTRWAGGLSSFVYIAELRSTEQVHPTLQGAVADMVAAFEEQHPEVLLHVGRPNASRLSVKRGSQTITEKRA